MQTYTITTQLHDNLDSTEVGLFDACDRACHQARFYGQTFYVLDANERCVARTDKRHAIKLVERIGA